MMVWIRDHCPAFRGERGTTLVELVVVVSILGVVLTFVTKGLITMQDATVGQSYRLQNLDEARTLMNTVSRDIRSATRLSATSSPFTFPASGPGSVPAPGFGHSAPYAGDNEVWFYSNLTLSTTTNPNPCPDVVHLYVDTSVNPPVLKEQILSDTTSTDAPPTCTYPSATSSYSTRLVGKYVANPSTEPVFTYWYDDSTGAPAAFPQTSTQTSTGLAPSDMLNVDEIGVTLAIRESNNFHAPYTTLVNRVSMPNIDYNPIPSPS
jgi:prepilin-type N-terminal cleavage/methylation domain